MLSENVDQRDYEDLGDEPSDFIGDTVVPEFVKSGQLSYWGETPIEEEVRKFEKVGQKSEEPTKPGVDREWLFVLENEKDEEDACRKVSEQLLKKGIFVAFDFLSQTLSDVPMGDKVFEEM